MDLARLRLPWDTEILWYPHFMGESEADALEAPCERLGERPNLISSLPEFLQFLPIFGQIVLTAKKQLTTFFGPNPVGK